MTVTVGVSSGRKVEALVVHKGRIKTGRITCASPSDSLAVRGQAMSSRLGPDGAWEKRASSTSLPPQPDATMSVSTLRPAAQIEVQRSAIEAEGKEAGVRRIFHAVPFPKPLTTRPASSFLHSIISTNMRGSGFPLSP